MDKEQLLHRKADIEQQFTTLQKNAAGIDDELKRLQGEHRLLVDLLEGKTVLENKPRKRMRKIKPEEQADA